MASSKTPTPTINPKLMLTPDAIARGIKRLDERVVELEAFDINTLIEGDSPQLTQLEIAIKDTLGRCFGENTSIYHRFIVAADLIWVPGFFSMDGGRINYADPTQKNITNAIVLLKEAQRTLREDLVDYEHASNAKTSDKKPSAKPSNRVFVVHGHDDAALQSLARFLEKLGLKAIVLKEQPDQGRTIIEKFEDSAGDVGFAVVLLTPDDLGGSAQSEAPDARVRQNVIFELGFFAGKLGRGRVCLLRKGHVEIPSDLYGVIYTEMDSGDGWQTKLVRELKAAKLDFDANKLWD